LKLLPGVGILCTSLAFLFFARMKPVPWESYGESMMMLSSMSLAAEQVRNAETLMIAFCLSSTVYSCLKSHCTNAGLYRTYKPRVCVAEWKLQTQDEASHSSPLQKIWFDLQVSDATHSQHAPESWKLILAYTFHRHLQHFGYISQWLRLAGEQAISKGQNLPLSVGQHFQHPLYVTGKLPVAHKAARSAEGKLADMKGHISSWLSMDDICTSGFEVEPRATCFISHTVTHSMSAGHCCLTDRTEKTCMHACIQPCFHPFTHVYSYLRVHDWVEGCCAFVIIDAGSKQVDHAVTLIVCGLGIHVDWPLSFTHAQHHSAEGLPQVLCNLLWRWLPLQLLQLVRQLMTWQNMNTSASTNGW